MFPQIIQSSNLLFIVGLPVRALVKNGSLGFFERWLVCRQKPNVPFGGRAFYTDAQHINLFSMTVSFSFEIPPIRKRKTPYNFHFLNN